jgi:hypothetical protein
MTENQQRRSVGIAIAAPVGTILLAFKGKGKDQEFSYGEGSQLWLGEALSYLFYSFVPFS